MIKKRTSALSVAWVLITSVVLQGCSGHPGAGQWESRLSGAISKYSALELAFDGKGTLHPNKLIQGQEEKADLWCVWQAKSAVVLDVQCSDGSVEKTNIKFEFTVTGEKQEGAFTYNQASLATEGRIVAIFDRKP
jgi:hypothetical protein